MEEVSAVVPSASVRRGIAVDHTVCSTDDTGRNGLAVAECVADRNDLLADLNGIRIAHRGNSDAAHRVIRDLGERNGDDGKIVIGIGTFDICLADLIVYKTNRKSIGIFYYMVIGDDQKLGVILSDDDTGTAACGLLGLRSLGTVTEHAEVVLYSCTDWFVMETIDGIAFFAIVETSIVPVEVELEDVAAAFKRLLLEVVCCAVVVVAVAVVLPAKWLTAWKVPPATPPNRTALKAMAPIFFASLAAFFVFWKKVSFR